MREKTNNKQMKIQCRARFIVFYVRVLTTGGDVNECIIAMCSANLSTTFIKYFVLK